MPYAGREAIPILPVSYYYGRAVSTDSSINCASEISLAGRMEVAFY